MGFVVLILGLALWAGLHLCKPLAPAFRSALQDRLGDGSKGLIALGLVLSVVLMWWGYRSAALVVIWTSPSWMTHLNNLLMLLAFYMFLTTATKPGTAFMFGNLKNPQLTGFKVWAVAHLLVNGDLAALILFGGLLAWAVAEVIVAKRRPSAVDRTTAPIGSPWVHLALVLVAFAGVAALHSWLGRWPFG
ncbi:MAG: NnrU family protein [Pseudomonadota bacterium]